MSEAVQPDQPTRTSELDTGESTARPVEVSAAPEPVLPPPPEIKRRGKLSRALSWALDKVTAAGVPIVTVAGGMASFGAELVGPATLWLPKIGIVAAGYGIDKWGGRHPNSRVFRLAQGFGRGVWKGGAFGFLSSLAVNTIVPTESGVLATEQLADKIQSLDVGPIADQVKAQIGGFSSGVSQAAVPVTEAVGTTGAEVGKVAGDVWGELSSAAGAVGAEIGPRVPAAGPQLGEIGKGIQEAVATPTGKAVATAGTIGAIGAGLAKLKFWGGRRPT